MTSREQAVEVMAEALYDEAEHLRHGGKSWADVDEAVRVGHRSMVRRPLDVLLAARVPCPTCSGTGDVPGRPIGDFAEHPIPCPAGCDDGRGGPLVLLGPVQVGWRWRYVEQPWTSSQFVASDFVDPKVKGEDGMIFRPVYMDPIDAFASDPLPDVTPTFINAPDISGYVARPENTT